jgi:hypothetical protein
VHITGEKREFGAKKGVRGGEREREREKEKERERERERTCGKTMTQKNCGKSLKMFLRDRVTRRVCH